MLRRVHTLLGRVPCLAARPIGRAPLFSQRFRSTAILDDDAGHGRDFTESFLDVVRDELPHATDPAKSSALLRRLVKSELLRFTDMRDAPEKFFLAHRLLSSVGL